MGKEITRKIQVLEESDEDEQIVEPLASNNPWLGGTTPVQQEITSGYRKLWTDINKSKELRDQEKTTCESNGEDGANEGNDKEKENDYYH